MNLTPNLKWLTLLLGLLSLFPSNLNALDFEKDFVVVFIDKETEAKYGPAPISRNLICRSLERIAQARAKGVVLKFFYDQPKDPTIDGLLAAAISKQPVVLQARLDEGEKQSNLLPSNALFYRQGLVTSVKGNSGWLPLPTLASKAKAVGFVDTSSEVVPLLETYQDKTVKSLALCSIELALGMEATIHSTNGISWGKLHLTTDKAFQVQAHVPKEDKLTYLPFHQLLEEESAMKKLTGKVVIIGYDGPNIHTFETAAGKMRAHRVFVHSLASIYQQISAEN